MTQTSRSKVSELSDRELKILVLGVSVGRCFWDGYYGSDDDIIKMISHDIIDLDGADSPRLFPSDG